MLAAVPKYVRIAVAVLLISLFVAPQGVLADEHVVSPSDLQKQTINAARAREQNIQSVREFFGSERAHKALQSAKIDSNKVQNAIAQLSDAELARLAAKTNAAQKDFAAGSLSNQDLTYIIIALATAVVVIILIKA